MGLNTYSTALVELKSCKGLRNFGKPLKGMWGEMILAQWGILNYEFVKIYDKHLEFVTMTIIIIFHFSLLSKKVF